ncbi:hypothetical protein GOODEAATRI_009801, partial [Goodea atripinnis]
VVQHQKSECSQKLEDLNVWLAGAAGVLASQRAGPESGDVDALQDRQKKLKAIRSVEEFLAEKGESLSPEEKKNLQMALRRLKEQYTTLTDSANTSLSELDMTISTTERLRKSETLKDELTKFLQEHRTLGSWLEQSEQELRSLGEGETDAQGLKNRQEEHRKDVICHKADLRFVSISGQKVLDSVQGALEQVGGSDPSLESIKQLVSDKLQDANHRYTTLHTKEGLKGLLSWLDKLVLNPRPVKPTAQAIQDALTQNQKLRQELLSRQGSVEATRDSVSKLLQSSDSSTAPGLHGNLDELTQRYAAAQASQAEREAELKGLLPRLESYERLGTDLQVFTQSRLKALSPVGQPDRSMDDYRQTVEEVKSELNQEAGQLKSFCSLGTELSQSKALSDTQSLLDHVKDVTDEFTKLEENVNERFAAILACDQRLHQFRGLSGSLVRWLQTAQDQLPSKEANLTTEGVPQINGSAGPSSLNGIHTCKGELSPRLDPLQLVCHAWLIKLGTRLGLTDLQQESVTISDVNARYDALGSELKERLSRQQASLELRQKARQSIEVLRSWLSDREQSLKQGQTTSPSKPEVVRAQTQQNKVLLSELAEHSGKVEELKSTLRKLIADNPDSPEADAWRQQLQEIGTCCSSQMFLLCSQKVRLL